MSGKLEGNGAARFIQLMRQHGYNTDVEVAFGTVTSAPPTLKIRLDGDSFDLDADDLVVAERLTEHKRTVSLKGGEVNGDTTGDPRLTSLTITDAELTIKSALKKNDRVIVLVTNDGQQYYVIDKAVTY